MPLLWAGEPLGDSRKTFTPHWVKHQCRTLNNTPVKKILNTLHNPSLQTWQSLRPCTYIITQVTGAPKLPYLHEWACHSGSEILRGQDLLPGLSNYTLSYVPLWSHHHYFQTHCCHCHFIFYSCEIMKDNRAECFALPLSLFSRVVTIQCFILPQGTLWGTINSHIFQPLQCTESTNTWSQCDLLYLSY